MNADHADAMVLYCRAFSKATEVASASMTGVDGSGFDMSAMTLEGPRPVRLAFDRPVGTPEEVRATLISMLKDARIQSELTLLRGKPRIRLDLTNLKDMPLLVRRDEQHPLVGV